MNNNGKTSLVSVIVPIYKVEAYLPKCIDSIINQTYKDLEIILVDDGSPDNCGKICDEYAKKDSRIKVIHKTNGGVSSARNLGVENCTGDFITYVDADDYLEPTIYAELMAKQKERDADLVFCRFKCIVGEKEYLACEASLKDLSQTCDIKSFYTFGKVTCNQDMYTVEKYVMCSIWRILFKKTAVKNIRFNTNIKYMEDMIYLTEILCHNDKTIDYVDRYLYNYLIRPNSASRSSIDGVIESYKNFLQAMTSILVNTQYAKYLPALKFFCYSDVVSMLTRFNIKESLKDIKDWNSSQNYRAKKKLTFGFKGKLKFFLIHYKLNFILKILLKIKDRG